MANNYKSDGLNDSQIKNKMNESFDCLLKSLPDSIVNRLNENHISSFNQKASWKLCPSLLTITTVSVKLAKLNLLTSQSSKPSDFGDILHTAYIPHVDIFRADKATADIIKQAKLPFETTIVSKLTDLPSEIENLLMLKSVNCTNDK